MTNNYSKSCRSGSLAILLLWGMALLAQPSFPKYEVRAAWLTVAYGLDWPSAPATDARSIEKQQQELIGLLDKLYRANFNTVLFQVRTRAEVVYPSGVEPFSAVLSGKSGVSPGYDPLAFVIEECHKRGMECHAWIVAIPLGSKKHHLRLSHQSVTRKRPALCVSYKEEWFLNPGHPGTKTYLMELVDELITRYDVDGVHFDYLRYPERSEKSFPDQREYRAYGKGMDKNQWRRENLTAIVRHIYQGVKARKPWVKVSTSPVGKYADTFRYSSKGWNAYHTVGQDVDAWLAEGIQDQVYPMMYFRGNNFYPFALDWKERSRGRQIIPGLGIYFLDPAEGNWELADVERQLHFTRYTGMDGQAYYRTEFLDRDTKGVYGALLTRFYPYPALTPPLSWLENRPPPPPSALRVEKEGDGVLLSWQPAPEGPDVNYVIYGADEFPVDISNPAHLIARGVRATAYHHLPVYPWEYRSYFAVTAVDRYGNESEAVYLPNHHPGPVTGIFPYGRQAEVTLDNPASGGK